MISSLRRNRPRLSRSLCIPGTLIAVLLMPAAASAAGQAGPAAVVGSSVHGVAAEVSGKVIAAGSAGPSMLVQRVAADGSAEPAFAAGTGVANAVAVQANGDIVVAGTDGGPVVRRFTPAGVLDPTFGTAGTVKVPGMAANAVAVGPGGTIVVGGSIAAADGFPRVSITRLLPSGAADKTFAGSGSATIDLGKGSQVNGLAVQADGKVVFAGQQAPGLQVTGALIGRTTAGGALDAGFANAGVYAYDAQGGANSALDAVAIDALGRIVAAGTDIRNTGSLATFVRLSPSGALDAGFGTGGVIRTPASVNSSSGDPIGARGIAIAGGGGEIVGVGAFQDSGLRSAALWAITPAGKLDPAVGSSGLVVTKPTTSSNTESLAVAVTPDGNIVAGGENTNFASASTGVLQRYTGFGALPAPTPITTPIVMPPLAAAKAPAKLEVLRAGITGNKLDVLASITSRATGKLAVSFVNHGTTTRFSVAIPRGSRQVKISKTLSSKARTGGTGILTLTYAGNDKVRADDLRLRAASGKALLKRKVSKIDAAGFLVVSGTVSSKAQGVVRVRYVYVDNAQRAFTLNFRAPIKSGKWSVEAKLPDAAAKAGGQLSIQYTGYVKAKIRGEQAAKAVKGTA